MTMAVAVATGISAPSSCFKPNANAGARRDRRLVVASVSGSWEQQQKRRYDIPKREPFSRDRSARPLSFLDRVENIVKEECNRLDGDEAAECHVALDEFENMKASEGVCEIASPERKTVACQPVNMLHRIVRGSSDVDALINNLKSIARLRSAVWKPLKKSVEEPMTMKPVFLQKTKEMPPFLEPSSVPKSEEELQEEQEALMPDSPFTRLLRRRGLAASWFSRGPDFETA